MLCTRAEVILGCPDLNSDIVQPVLAALIDEAEAVVKADLEGWYDWQAVELEPIPLSIKRLGIAKARELGYRKYYGAERMQNSEVDYFRKDYDRQLADIRAGRSALSIDAMRETSGEVGFY